MRTRYRFFGLLRADLKERTRTLKFWLILAGMTWVLLQCFPGLDAGYLTLTVNQNARGFYSSAWTGMVLAMINTMLLSLGGFYLVRGTLTRDIETRVWQLLVSTTMTRSTYLLAKWASHMVIMGILVLIGLVIAGFMQWWRAEDRQMDLIELVKPSLVLSLPGLAITATFAIWFDLVPWLRKTAGNVLFFFVWTFLTAVSVAQFAGAEPERALASWQSDPNGMAVAGRDFYRKLTETEVTKPEFGFSIGSPKPKGPVQRFEWTEWDVRGLDVLGRGIWLVLALAGVLAAAPFLDRAAAHAGTARLQRRNAGARLWWLTPVFAVLQRLPGGVLLVAELKLGLRTRRWWWWLGAIGLLIAQSVAAPQGAHVAMLIALAWPLDLLAGSLLREPASQTGGLVFTARQSIERLLWSRWVAGVLVLLALTLPSLLRGLGNDPMSTLALLVVVLSLPALALALAMVTRNERPFELLIVATVYVAIQGAPLFQVGVAPWATLQTHGLVLAVSASVLMLWRQHWVKAAISR